MSQYKFDLDQKVVCIVGGKYRGVPENAPGVVRDQYQSDMTLECVYEVEFGHDLILVRESDLMKG